MNKFKNFPTAYYLSLEESIERQKNIENEFLKYNIKLNPIISKRFSESNDKIFGKHLNQLNSGTAGCCVSHLKAIKDWYDNYNDDYAFFCEDDLSLETVKYWNFSWDQFIENVPKDYDCIQLLTIRKNFDTFTIRERYWDDWAATAYIIRREYAKKIIDTYIKEDTFNLEIPNVEVMPLIENILFTIGKTYTIPLFVENTEFDSTFSKAQDDDVNEGQKNNHKIAHDIVLNYWKSKMNTNLSTLLTEFSLDTENAINNFNLGVWYENSGHTAPALSYFLRCAERSDDDHLAYEALIRASYCYDKQGTRDGSAKSLLEQALCLLPTRPEAYFLLSRFAERRQWWQDCYIHANNGLMFAEHDSHPDLITDVEYPGYYGLLFEKAISGWWWGKNEECKNILLDIKDNYTLNEVYQKSVYDNLKKIGVEILEESSNYFHNEYLNACNTPSDINENLHILFDLANECEHVTEFGVRSGVSTRAFLNTNVSLRSYDLEKNSVVTDLFEMANSIGKDAKYYEEDVLNVEIEETDLLFFDTWHHYEQLKQELNKHSSKVRKYLVFHDTHTYAMSGEKCSNASSGNILTDTIENPEGLLPAIIEFMVSNSNWIFKVYKKNNNGLIVLEKKTL
jgi:hypothetical protein